MKYVITVLSVLLFLTAHLTWLYQKKNDYLNAEIKAVEAQYELVKTHINQQNEAIQKANETLKNYQGKIAELQKEYDLKLSAYKKQIKSIKKCEDGYNYLKTMLEELKNAN